MIVMITAKSLAWPELLKNRGTTSVHTTWKHRLRAKKPAVGKNIMLMGMDLRESLVANVSTERWPFDRQSVKIMLYCWFHSSSHVGLSCLLFA